MDKEFDGKVFVEVSRDRLSAIMKITPPEANGTPADVDLVLSALDDAGVVFGIVSEDRMKVFLEEAVTEEVEFIAANGTMPGIGKDGWIEYAWEDGETQEKKSDDRVNLRDVIKIATVKSGDVIAMIHTPERGSEGVAVTGEKSSGEWGEKVVLKPGVNVTVNDGGTEFTATLSGSPRLIDGCLSVDPVYKVDGDVDFSVGNIEFNGTVEIKGSVMDGFMVKAGGSITVGGSVQAAVLEAVGDVNVYGGIITRHEGRVSAEGSVRALFVENSIVQAKGDVVVERAIINSKVYSNANVICLSNEGRIISGDTMAFYEIRAKSLGTENESTTILRAGLKYDYFKLLSEYEKQISALDEEIAETEKNIKSAVATGRNEHVKAYRTKLDELKEKWRLTHSKLVMLKSKLQLNPLACVKGEDQIFPGCEIYIGMAREKVSRVLRFASLSADSGGGISLHSYDEKTGRMITSGVGEAEKKKTVMIVDDAKFMRKKLRSILENCNFTIAGEADDGMQAVKLYAELKPDVVTMDITMPLVDGLTALKAIKKVDPAAKVIMISALGQKEKVRDSIVAGAKDFIIKPFVAEKVAEIVSRVVYT